MGKRVLLIDDDESFLELIGLWLERAGYEVTAAADGMEGLRRISNWGPDLVILDPLMPGMDGWEACRRIRKRCNIPIIMLAGRRDGWVQELKALQEGAGHYMTKAPQMPVLQALILVLLRRGRVAPPSPVHNPIIVCDLEIDLAERSARKDGYIVELSPTEFRLLAALAVRHGQVVPREQLIREVWDESFDTDLEQSLRLYIHYLRRKIESDPANPQYIMNRRGVGYVLARPEQCDSVCAGDRTALREL